MCFSLRVLPRPVVNTATFSFKRRPLPSHRRCCRRDAVVFAAASVDTCHCRALCSRCYDGFFFPLSPPWVPSLLCERLS